MRNQKGISLIKIILIIFAVIIAISFLMGFIMTQKEEKEAQEYQRNEIINRYASSYNIGDTITTDSYEITVTNVEERTKVGVAKHYSTVDDYYYTLVCTKIKLKNISSTPKRIYDYRPDFSMFFKLEDEEQREFSNEPSYTTYYQFEFDNLDAAQLTLKPGETVTVTPVFKMSKNSYQTGSYYMKILGNTALVRIK